MFYFLLKYDQIKKAHRKPVGFEGMLSKKNTQSSTLIANYFLGSDFEKTYRKAEFEGESKGPWSLNPDTS